MNRLFIRQNLKQIHNADDVNFICRESKDIGNGIKQYILKAGLANKQELPLSYPVSWSEFFEYPLDALSQAMGQIFTEEFVRLFDDDIIIININNYVDITAVQNSKDKKYVDATLIFKGQARVGLYPIKVRKFNKLKERLDKIVAARGGKPQQKTTSSPVPSGWKDDEDLPSIDDEYYKD